jgi:DNA-binding transcriptional ArsR family regulator
MSPGSNSLFIALMTSHLRQAPGLEEVMPPAPWIIHLTHYTIPAPILKAFFLLASRQSLRKPFMALFSDSWHVAWISRTHLPEDPFFLLAFQSGKKSHPGIDTSIYANILIYTVLIGIILMGHQKKVEQAAEILKSIAHPIRLRIAELLQGGEMTVGQIQSELGVSQPLTSQQLLLMKARGILQSRKNGKSVHYFIAMPQVIQVIECLKKC